MAILAVVSAIMLLGYRPTSPNDGGIAAAAVPPAYQIGQEPVTQSDRQADASAAAQIPDTGAFDLDTAMNLAGQQVPTGTDSFYFFAFVDDVPAEQEIGELAEKLKAASQEHDFLGIAGPDAQRNRRNLTAALKAATGEDLSGAMIIYVGPVEQRGEIEQLVETAGAKFRFVPYPEGHHAVQL